MAIHMTSAGRLRTVQLPEQQDLPNNVIGKHLVWILALAILSVCVVLAGLLGPATEHCGPRAGSEREP